MEIPIDGSASVDKILGRLFAVVMAAVAFVSWLFMPFLAYPLGLASIYLSKRYLKPLLIVSIVLFCLGGVTIQSSRDFFRESSDFVNYYHAYELICSTNNPLSGVLFFGGEIGLPVIYYGLSELFGCGIPIAGLAFVQGMVFSVLFLSLVDKYLTRRVPETVQPFLLVAFAAMFSFYYLTQLSRQMISTYFLFFAIYAASSTVKRYSSLLIAMFFHMSSPVIFIADRVLRNRRLASARGNNRNRVAWPLSVFGVFFLVALLVVVGRDSIIVKLAYYSDGNGSKSTLSDYVAVLMLLGIGAMAYLLKSKALAYLRDDFRVVIRLGMLGIFMLPFPLLATRTLLMYTQIVSWVLLFFVVNSLNRWLAYIFLAAVVMLKFMNYAGLSGGDDTLWSVFSSSGSSPGYFINGFIYQ